MSARPATSPSSFLAGLLSLLLLAGVLGLFAPHAARADSAPLDPANPVTPRTVTADPLPTVQINGVAWAQVVVGNTVYVAGDFTRARPAGAAPGTQEVVRSNLLAYDIRTGELNPTFDPFLNGQAVSIAATPDGSRIYVGGDFTSVDGQARTRIAAFSTATGQLVPGFAPAFNSQVYTLAVTNTTVYGGGWFTAVGTTARRHVAAVSGTTGALLPWAPALSPGNIATPSAAVMGLTVTNGGQQVVMSGRFAYINGVAATGVGAVDAATGATRPFAVNKLITNQGANAGVYSLTSVGDTVYGTGYTFGSPGNFEGTFAAAADGGAVRWIHTCHGDTYSAFPSNGVVYQASHAHNCTNIGSFPEQNPQVWNYGTAVSDSVAGTLGAQNAVEQVIAGQPAPALLPWFPTFYAGSYTGQWQAGWSVTGNSQYVVYGGEFPAVNGSEQQGLVRFAVPELAPNKVGPRTTGTWTPSATMVSGAVRISWKAVADRDNENLTYRVYRDDAATTPVCEVVKPSTWWNLPTYACGDTAATAGAHRYLVAATDPAGNRLDSQWINTTVPASSSSSARGYTEAVRADGASSYWSLNEKSGTTAVDQAGSLDMTVNAGITRGRAGAIAGDADTAYDVNGSTTGFLATQTAQAAPKTFTAEAWFQTTTNNGGKILGFGNRNTGNSTSYDRHVYLDTAGRLLFGVNNGAQRTVTSAKTYNDGSWHHVAASLSPAGMALYVDGELVGSDAAVTSGLALSGYWRVGGDASWSGAAYLAGRVDEVAVYGTALTPAQVKRHNDLGRGLNIAPTAAFTSASVDQTATVDASGSSDVDGSVRTYAWDFGDGATGTGQKASHTYAKPGTYAVKLTVTDDDGATGTTTAQVTVTAPPVGPGSVAKDTFGRTVASGWGTADLGGPWTIGGGLSNATVANGAGQLTGAAGRTLTAALDGVARRDAAVQTDVVLVEAPTGGGTFISLAGRRVGESDYRATVRVQSTGAILLRIDRVLNGVETVLASQELPGRYTAGSALSLRLEAEGAAPTALRAKAWAAGTPEPTWQLTATDSSAALQVPGGFFVETYTSGSATRPQVMRFDNLRAEASGAVTEPVNVPPTASFVFDVKELALTVDGAGSTDPEGAVAGYAWDFGNGSTGTGRTAAHTYATAGTYPVKLTVTDGAGATGTVTQQVTVAKAVPPPAGAPLVADAFGREVATGFGVADVGGAWQTFGTAGVTGGSGRITAAPRASSGGWLDVSAQDVVLQADVSLDRAATGGGTFVSFGTRNLGATRYNGQLSFAPNGTVGLSLVTVVNWNETEKAAITLPGTYAPGTVLTIRMEATGTGTTTLRAKAWTKGTTEPAWMITATDTTASLQKAGGIDTEIYQSGSATTPNTYRIDNLSLTKPGTVAEPANVAPTAAFTSAVTGLAVAVDGSGSTDPEGAVAGYAWDFGNGSTGTGRTATHTYATAGTYPVKLTVTDAAGATGTVTKQVTVAEVAPPPAGTALVRDAFGREVAGGLGTADVGGAWQTFGNVGVAGGSARITAAPKASSGGWLTASAQDVVLQADVALEQAVTGGGSFVSFGARNLGATRYNGQLSFAPNGTVQLSLVTVVNWNETEKAAITLPGTYTPGTVLTVRMEVSGTGTTTLRAKAWVKGTPEPAAWMITATDTTASLQKAGGIDTEIYQSGSATTPNTYRLDNLWVGKAGDIPPAA